jgi:hypothetical protein
MLNLERLSIVFRASRDAVGHPALPDLIDDAIAVCKTLGIVKKCERREWRRTSSELSLLNTNFRCRLSGGIPTQDTVCSRSIPLDRKWRSASSYGSERDPNTRIGIVRSSRTRYRSARVKAIQTNPRGVGNRSSTAAKRRAVPPAEHREGVPASLSRTTNRRSAIPRPSLRGHSAAVRTRLLNSASRTAPHCTTPLTHSSAMRPFQ